MSILGEWRDDIRVVCAKDPAARTIWEVMTYAGVWAVLSHRVAHSLWTHGIKFPARLLSQISRAITGMRRPGRALSACPAGRGPGKWPGGRGPAGRGEAAEAR